MDLIGGWKPPPPINRNELLADVREDFNQVEAAISTAEPDRCRAFVGPEFYEQLVGTVRELTAHGHRRVHGAFEILKAEIIAPDPDADTFPAQDAVRIYATSSLVELDRQNRVVQGSPLPIAWTQDLLVRHDSGAGRWIISELGPMEVRGPVSGPSGQPLTSPHQSELERRERDSQEHGAAFVTATLNFLKLTYDG